VARTLLVEDDEAVRGILARTLVAAGYEVEEAANGEVALAAYRRQASDVVITDLVMPEKNGLEMIMEMRRLDPGVKIIAMSGGGRTLVSDMERVGHVEPSFCELDADRLHPVVIRRPSLLSVPLKRTPRENAERLIPIRPATAPAVRNSVM
jgi:DNA-binding NtrC family response regulator